MTVTQLRELAAAEYEAARDIQDKVDSESRGMTEQEANDFDAHMNKGDEITGRANRQERLEKAEKKLEEPVETKSKPEITTGERIEVTGGLKFHRYGQLRAFKGPKAEINAYRAGRFLMATVMDHAESRQWCREHGIEIRVQTEGVNTSGGYIVPDELEQSIIDLKETYGMFQANAFKMPMGSDHINIPRRSGGVTAYFVGETDATTASDMEWNQVELTAKELAALTRVSASLADDAIINVADIIANEMAWAFAKKEDECGLDGDGSSTYGGMTGIRTKFVDGGHTAGYDAGTTPCTAWSHITLADEIVTVMALLPAYAIAGAKWFISPAGKAGCFDALALAAGGNTTLQIAAGAQPMFAGYPVVVSAAMPAAPTNGTVAVLFGDLSLASTIGVRKGITISSSKERYFEYRQIAIQATERFCINNHDIGDTSTAGPVVALVGTT